MELFFKRLIESRCHISRRAVFSAGMAAAGVLVFKSSEIHAQSSTPYPSLVPAEAPFLQPDIRQLSNEQKHVYPGLYLPPKPEAKYVEPTDFNQIIKDTAQAMGISEEHARRIIQCESSNDPKKENPVTKASGWWQIMPSETHQAKFRRRGWNYWRDRFNPYKNSQIAIEIKEEEGLAAWNCK